MVFILSIKSMSTTKGLFLNGGVREVMFFDEIGRLRSLCVKITQ